MSSLGFGLPVDQAIGNASFGSDRRMVFYKKEKSSNSWSLADSISLGTVQKADYKGWNGDPGVLDIYRFGDADYGFVQFPDNCEIHASGASPYSLFAVSAQKIVGGFTLGRRLTESDPNDFQWSLLMLGYGIESGKLVQQAISFRNFIENKKFYTLACDDVNGDGRSDVFISNWGTAEKPDIYINLADRDFALVNPEKIPEADASFDGAHALYEDVTGDGVRDMVYIARSPSANANSLRFQVFRGERRITSNDLK
jgi:hypothetical protein